MLLALRTSVKYKGRGCVAQGNVQTFSAIPNPLGFAGHVNFGSAPVEHNNPFAPDYRYDSPCAPFSFFFTFLPFSQMVGRYVNRNGVRGFIDGLEASGYDYGRHKGKVSEAKLRPLDKSGRLSSVEGGAANLQRTELVKGTYIVASKTFNADKNIEVNMNYGRKLPHSTSARMGRTRTSVLRWSVAAEYDATHHKTDRRAPETVTGQHSAEREGQHRGWLALPVASRRENSRFNAFGTISFSESKPASRIIKPSCYQKTAASWPSINERRYYASSGATLIEALAKQDFKKIRVRMQDYSPPLRLTKSRISKTHRVLRRAARAALGRGYETYG